MGAGKYLTMDDFIYMTSVVRGAAESAGRGYVLPDNGGWTRYLFPEKSVRGVYAGVYGDNAYVVKQCLEGGRHFMASGVVTMGWRKSVRQLEDIYSKTGWSGLLTVCNMTGRGMVSCVIYTYNGTGGFTSAVYPVEDGVHLELRESVGVFYPLYQYCKERGYL